MNSSLSTILVLTLMLAVNPLTSHSQYWMQKGGSITVDEGMDIAVDPSGNTYTTGYFTGTISFGSFSLSSNGGSDIFVVKTNGQGVYQWAVKAGGNASDRGLSINTDASGNVYVCGFFNGTAAFGSSSITSAGNRDAFVAKYNTSGVLQWVQRAGGPEADAAYGVSADVSGNVAVTGEFKDTASFGSATFSSLLGTSDVFVSKLNSSGTFLWTKHGQGNFTDRGIDVDFDNAGNVYATGQFSDTITFDNQHNNVMFNAIYTIKFNASGAEQWFRIAGAGLNNIANSIATDANGNSYLTGDFGGTVTFNGSPSQTLTGLSSYNIFVAKYNASGQIQWTTGHGSDNELTSRSIAIDGAGNSYIAGHFSCDFDDYRDEYGEANFNSVGFNDIFVAQYDPDGDWVFSRHFGSKQEDHGNGAAVNASGQILFTGSYKADISMPTSTNFLASNLNQWIVDSCAGNSPYCGDPNYGLFHKLTTAGNSDVLIANCADTARQPLDYYLRSGSSCLRDVLSVCIDPGCPDTVTICGGTYTFQAISMTCPSVGPSYNYQWAFGGTGPTNLQSAAGTKWVKQSSIDGCYESTDTIELVINGPEKPSISDDVVVNTNSQSPFKIILCDPDTVNIWVENLGANSVLWTGPGLGSGSSNDTITTSIEGVYTATYTDTNGCVSATGVEVEFDDPLPPFILKENFDDSIQICAGTKYEAHVYDSVSNPTALQNCFNYPTVAANWTVSGNSSFSLWPPASCGALKGIVFQDTGWYYIEVEVFRLNACEADTHLISDSIYVDLLPTPVVNPFNIVIDGSSYFCPEDTTTLIAQGGVEYIWTGPTVNGSTSDTIYAYVAGLYEVKSTVTDTNSFGCVGSYTDSAAVIVQVKPQPEIFADTLIICPEQTVQMSCVSPGTPNGAYFWEGPSGPLSSNNAFVSVDEPGVYFCIVNDQDSCGLVSNSLTLTPYATPSLAPLGNNNLCSEDSVVIGVVASEGAIIEWQAPLSGDSTRQVVTEPGIYTCMIEVCDIQTFATIEVQSAAVPGSFTFDGILCKGASLELFGAEEAATYFWWPSGASTPSLTVTTGGNVALTVTDTNGCVAMSDTVFIPEFENNPEIFVEGEDVFCVDDSVTLVSVSFDESYLWSPTNDTTQSITVYDEGTYTLTTVDERGCVGSTSRSVFHAPTVATLGAAGSFAFCEGESVTLSATATGLETTIWYPGGDTNRSLTVTESGTYALTTIDQYGCVALSDSIQVYVQENKTTTPFFGDTTLCAGEELTIIPENEFGEIQWSLERGGEPIHTGASFSPSTDQSRQYWIWSAHELCISGFTPFWVNALDCDNIWIPNVFTPNGDGHNDIWRAKIEEYTCLHCYIFNRWGMLIYEVDMLNTGWDGTVGATGNPAPDGVYYYVVDYCKFNGEKAQQRGDITLVRDKK